MKSIITVIVLASFIGISKAEIASHTYWVKEKNITIFYPDSNPDWNDQLQGAYCRNAVYQLLKTNSKLRKKVKEAECLHLEDQEEAQFSVSDAYDEKMQKLMIPFNFVKGKRQYPFLNEIVRYVEEEQFLIQKSEQEVKSETLDNVDEKDIATENEKIKSIIIEDSKNKESEDESSAETELSNEQSDIEEFVDSFSSDYSKILKGLPYIPKDPKLRESFRVFITKMKSDPDAKGFSIGSLTGAFKFFEENRNGIQDKSYLKKAKDNGQGAPSYNWEGIDNKDYIVIVNFTLSRYQNRFFVLNLKENKIYSTPVAHGYGSNTNGKNSDVPGRFSNINNSHMTSRGFYLTGGTYCSSRPTFGVCRTKEKAKVNAVFLHGLSETNWRAKERFVVFHGANYVTMSKGATGNSEGCPAVPLEKWDAFYENLKKGTLFYHYTNTEYQEYVKSQIN